MTSRTPALRAGAAVQQSSNGAAARQLFTI
jgi:hypothetical protein